MLKTQPEAQALYISPGRTSNPSGPTILVQRLSPLPETAIFVLLKMQVGKLLSSAILFFLSLIPAKAALLKGRITGEKSEGLSFVNVIVKGTTTGTSCNEDGYYELKIPAGEYDILFQYIGYKPLIEHIGIVADNETRVLNVQLEPALYALKDMQVTATAEDPAYPIMRQVIAHRRVYLNELKEFSCTAYLKGMQRLTTIPKRIMLMKVPENLKPGIIYLSESLSELNYRAPNQVREKMIASKVSGDNKGFSFNRAGSININPYENLITQKGLTERGLVSPLASNAFFFYKYKLEGQSNEYGKTIYKIRIIPIRENDPVFRGHIYIVKDSWRLHSTDLLLNKNAGIEFIDTMYIKQAYAPQANGVWVPISQRFIFHLEILGFRGNGYFVALYSKYKVVSNYPASFYEEETIKIKADEPTPQLKKVKTVAAKKEKKDSSMFARKFFSNEILSIDKKANKTDSATWEEFRPIPLTGEEMLDYHQKDSIQQLEESKPYLDSIDRINNKPDWADLLLTGYVYAKSYKKQYLRFDPVLRFVQYNTVEGFVVNPRITFIRTFDEDRRNYSITPNLRYGFSPGRFYGKLHAAYEFDPIKDAGVEFEGGSFISQYNSEEPISPAINTYYTLVEKQNHMKLYEKQFIKAAYSQELVNGIFFNGSVEYAQRSPLENTADFNLRKDAPAFGSNNPLNPSLPASALFGTHTAFITDIHFRIVFGQKYQLRPDIKLNYSSKYPTLRLHYQKGIAALSDVNFDRLAVGISHRWDLKLFGKSYWNVSGGTFINSSSVYFMDLKHFMGNQTILSLRGYNGFQLLDYYTWSTGGPYGEIHYSHHFNGFIFNKVPLLRKLKLQEVFSLNMLSTEKLPNYMELGAGIEHILKLLRIDYFASFSSGSFERNGIRLGFGF